MASGPVLRAFRADDEAALADLWVAAWQEAMPDIDFRARRAWLIAFLRGGGPGQVTTVAADAAGSPCGFASVEPATSYLHQLAVAPAAKGRGVATALLAAVKIGAPLGLTLDVNQANARALRFYEREGFSRESAGVNAASGLATWRMRWNPGPPVARR